METGKNEDNQILEKSNEEWKRILPRDVYHITRPGTYKCAVCGNPLFKSDGKFNSRCGSQFFEPISKESLIYLPDNSYGMKRTEV